MKALFGLTVAATTLLSGCVTVLNRVNMDELAPPPTPFVVDQTGADRYPGFMQAEGNIYSCRYGIHHQSRQEFSPPKEQIFAALLAKQLPALLTRQVTLQRFDVYINARLRALKGAGDMIGGGIGSLIGSTGNVNKNVFRTERLIVETDPEHTASNPKENAVGCDHRHEGEYFASQISGGHSVVVTWLRFEVDGTPYHFKTYYQFQPESGEHFSDTVAAALTLSFEAIAPKIALQ